MKILYNNKILYLCAALLLLMVSVDKANAQTPGGTGLTTEVWLSGDKVNGPGGSLPGNEASIETWSSVLPGGRSYVKNSHATATYNVVPTFITTGSNVMNFQPYLSFSQPGTKLVNKDRLLDLSKAYYVFYVSRRANVSGDNTLFAISANNGTNRGNNIGWYGGAAAPQPYMQIDGSDRRHQGNGKMYGVNAAIIPNKTGAGSAVPSSYMNGVANTATFAAATFDQGIHNMSVIGNCNYDDSYPFYGGLQELIVISADNNSTINAADLVRINSYLAIKYAITLEAGNYVNSSGTTVWDRSRAGYTDYNKNIFGLARDDGSGLHQKQAKSTDGKELTIYVGDELADLNVNNTSADLNNGDYLLLGSNATKGLVAYEYTKGTSFLEGSLEQDLDVRNKLVFRAQATRSFSDVKIVTSADYVLVSGNDASFAPGNTRIYKVEDGFASVPINDGDYISFAFYRGTPGGVTGYNMELWLAADRLSGGSALKEGDDVATWEDISGYGRTFVQNGTNAVPVYSTSGLNYQPAVNFYNDENETAAVNNARKLVSADVFPVSRANSYYAFYVSRLDSLSGYSTVFDWNAERDDNFGWNGDGNLWLETATTNYANTAVNKSYGIGTAIIPNNTSTGQVFYHDGVATTLAARQMDATPATNSQAVIGNSSLAAAEFFYGDIQEIIIYAGTQGQVMDATEMTKVNTYLAIKYGIDLQSNYISSANDVVWNRSDNAGYTKYVFGLANDPTSGLHVKQSASTEAGDIIAFVGDELADSNAENTGSVPENVYMMLGNTGGGELTSYRQNPDNNPPFQGQTLDEEVNFLSGTMLKVQLTGASSFTFNLVSPGQFIVVSQSPDFVPENTRLYKIDMNKEATEITVENGDYIGFALYATGPGGVVSGLRMWLDADNLDYLTLNAQGQVMAWRDKSHISNTVYTYDAVKGTYNYTYPPTYKASTVYTNFYPAVSFDSNSNGTTVGDHIEYLGTERGPSSVANPDAYTFINAIYTGDVVDQRSYFVSFGGFTWGGPSRHPVFGMIGGRTQGIVGRYYEVSGYSVYGTVGLFNVGATSLNYVSVKKRQSLTFESNGVPNTFNTTSIGTGGATKLNGRGMLGAGSYNYASLKGVVGQSIFYEKALTEEEKTKINTYLALKYATTVRPGGTGKFNYTLTDETSIWNGNEAPYSTYYNNIAAIVADRTSDLRNNIARSTDTGAMITIGLRDHSLGMSGQGDESLLPEDCSAIIWGNDGADINSTDKFVPFSTADLEKVCNAATQRTVRSWMIRKTNNLGEQKVTMYLRNGDFGSFVSSGYQPTLFIADSPEKIASNDFDRMIPGSYDKDLQAHVIHFTIYSEFTYFALGVKMLPGACETCDFEGGKTISFNRNGWANGTTTNNFNLGDDGTGEGDFTVEIDTKFETSTTSFYRGYPRASSQSTLRFRRRGATAPLMTTTIIPSTSAAASFHIFNLDRESRRFKEVEIYGECVNPSDGSLSTVYPDLKYTATGRRPRSSYQIMGNTGKAQNRPTSSYTANTGKMKVTFEYPVEKIFIKQHAPGTRTGAQDIGLGPITFVCPQPLPTFTEQGLSMTKQATDTVKLCGTSTVDYVFRVYNANCDRNIISISDTLPENMYWVEDLISIEESAMNHEKFAITISDDKRSLQIDSLIIPGSAFPFTFTAKAMFTDAAGEGIYENQAWLRTTILVEDVPVVPDPYPSADYYRGEGMKSKTVAIDGGVRFEPVTVSVSKSKDCYGPTNEITVTLNINNPTANNQPITDMFLDFVYNEEFEYVNNSVTSTISGLAPNPQFDLDGSTPYPGYFFFEGFTLPTGTSTISFKVKAPIKDNLVGEVDDQDRPLDWDGNVLTAPFDPDEQAKVELIISYDFTTEMNDDCISTTLDRANGDIIIPYCLSKECIITNRMLQPRLR